MKWSGKVMVVGTSVMLQLLDDPKGVSQSRVMKPEEVHDLVEALLDAAEAAVSNRSLSHSELIQARKNKPKSFVVGARNE